MRRLLAGLIALAVMGARAEAFQLLPKALDVTGAREFADQVVADAIGGHAQSLFKRMEDVFQKANPSATSFILDALYAYGGRPLEAQFKAADPGFKLYLDGTRKPMIKVWYAVRTTKSKKGKYFLVVEVVPDGGRLACTSVSVVSFANGLPEHLR